LSTRYASPSSYDREACIIARKRVQLNSGKRCSRL